MTNITNSGDKKWDNTKEGYLCQVEKSLLKVKRSAKKQILEDVSSHLDQKYAELDEDSRTWEGYQQIIIEMGPADDYAELLNEESQQAGKKITVYIPNRIVIPILAVILLGFAWWHGILKFGNVEANHDNPTPVDAATFLANFDEKLAGFDIDNADTENVINTFGEPTSYIWGQGGVFKRDDLPMQYIMMYPADFRVYMREGSVVEVRHEGPGTEYAFMGKLKIGTPLEEALDIYGMPDETVEGGKNLFQNNVLYMDMGGRKGYCYYARTDKQARLWFLNYELHAIYMTRSDYGKDEVGKSPKILEKTKQSLIDKLGAAEPAAYVVSFRAEGDRHVETAGELLEIFNGELNFVITTHHFRTEAKDGELIGHICVDTEDDADDLVEYMTGSEFIQIFETRGVNKSEFEKYKATRQVNLPLKGGIDISIKSCEIAHVSNGHFRINTTFQNISETELGKFDFMIEGIDRLKPHVIYNAGPIASNDTWNSTTSVFELLDGKHTIRVVIDPRDEVREIYENNNNKVLEVLIENGDIRETRMR